RSAFRFVGADDRFQQRRKDRYARGAGVWLLEPTVSRRGSAPVFRVAARRGRATKAGRFPPGYARPKAKTQTREVAVLPVSSPRGAVHRFLLQASSRHAACQRLASSKARRRGNASGAASG